MHWVNFTIGFLYQATKTNFNWAAHAAEKKHPSVGDLSRFVHDGVNGLEPTCSALGPIVEDTKPQGTLKAIVITEKRARARVAGRMAHFSDMVCLTTVVLTCM